LQDSWARALYLSRRSLHAVVRRLVGTRIFSPDPESIEAPREE
jgi:hypothetical protein